MRRLSDAAGMGRGRRRRQRERKKISGKREQQQKSSGQTLHVSWLKQNPPGWFEHRTEVVEGATSVGLADVREM
jgi:hypothetical protein